MLRLGLARGGSATAVRHVSHQRTNALRLSHPSVGRRLALLALAGCALLPAEAAQAGRLVATGHDADSHCSERDEFTGNCDLFKAAVDYARAGAPDPNKPVLVLDRGELDVVRSLDRTYGRGVPRQVVSPRSPEFAELPITTASFSAVIVASSTGADAGTSEDPSPSDLNSSRAAQDSDAINARAADLRAFYDAGGGIYVNSGNTHGDQPGDPYFAFLPLAVLPGPKAPPFTVTAAGRGFGLTRSDVNCCPSHNSFRMPPAGSPLQVAELDRVGNAMTLFAETPNLASIGPVAPIAPSGAQLGEQVAGGLPPTASCTRRRSIRFELRRPRGTKLRRAVVYVNKRRVRTLRGSRITRPFRVRISTRRTSRIRILVTTVNGGRTNIRRTYRRCR
jgi:hypothetical protein